METKTALVRRLLTEYRCMEALRVARTFRHLGPHKATIQRGWDAYAHPRFARSLGRDPDALTAEAIGVMRALFGPGALGWPSG